MQLNMVLVFLKSLSKQRTANQENSACELASAKRSSINRIEATYNNTCKTASFSISSSFKKPISRYKAIN